MRQKQTQTVALAALTLVLAFLTGCSRQVERSIAIAQCDVGALLVEENMVERRGFSGTTTSVKRSLNFHAADGRRVPVDVSPRGSYRLAAQDQLGVLREPRDGDWQVYVDPAAMDSRGYGELVNCLRSNSAGASPGPASASLPAIATIRYANLGKLRRRYECAKDARLDVREDGLVYFQLDSGVLLGAIFEGNVFAMDASALRYLASRGSRAIPHPLRYFRRCNDSSGVTMFDEFKISVMPEGTFWEKLEERQNELRRVYRELASTVRPTLMTPLPCGARSNQTRTCTGE